MAYLTLYRKYRSQAFDDVVGQEHVTRTLQNAIRRESIGQAYLFTGSRGTGKTTVARLLAKAVNCEKGPTPEPCNECPMCMAITLGSAADVAEIDAASNRGVSEMENICEGVRYQPMEARYRVVILDEAHQLSDHAKDAFLKTLEEPPPHAIFVLATTEPSKIPITIRSRCQQFDFHRGTPKQIEERLRYVCEQEGVELSDEAAHLIGAHAQGSWRDGLSLLEQVIAFAGSTIGIDDARLVLGAVAEQEVAEILGAVVRQDAAAVIEGIRRSWDSGADPARLLSALVEKARDELRLVVSGRSGDSEIGEIGARALIRLIYRLAESEANLKDWERADLAIEVALLGAMAAANDQQAAPARERPAAVEARPSEAKSAERPVAAPEAVSPAQPAQTKKPEVADAEPISVDGELDLEAARKAWPRVINRLRQDRVNTSLCAILKDGWPDAVEGSTVTIGYPAGFAFHVERTMNSASKGKIQDAFGEITGRSVDIRAVNLAKGQAKGGVTATPKPKTTASAGTDNTSQESPADSSVDESAVNTELVQEVLKTFGGKVLDTEDPYADN